MKFIPDLEVRASSVPWFEDNQKLKIPGRETTKAISTLQKEVAELLTQLGAFGIIFTPGTFEGTPKRFGFLIQFQYASARGRINVLALPIHHETPHIKEKALKQALYLFRNKLEAQVYSKYYEAEGVSLVPYLIGTGDQTVVEALTAGGNLPTLNGGKS